MSFYNGTIQKGSSGNEVKKWQEYLNTQGYGLSVDGDFGDNTYNATKEWQKKMGLTDDGIVGQLTWGKAGFKNVSTPTSAPTIAPTPSKAVLDTTSYLDTTDGKAKNQALTNATNAVNNFKDFSWIDQGKLDDYTSQYENRPDFQYDFNADALYQQYKDKYIKQGKMAMADVMGQASAMTGGYGNSYAQTVGNQAYQASLENLNDVIPELYQLAYDKYNQEGQDLLNAISLLRGERDFAKGLHDDKYAKTMDKYNIANNEYTQAADMYLTEQGIRNDAAQKNFENEFSIWDANTQNAWTQAEWDEAMRQTEIANGFTERELALKEQAYADSKNTTTTTGGGGGGNNSTGGGNNNTNNNTSNPPKEETPTAEFRGTSYSDAVSYMERNGVPSGYASGVMTSSEWNRRKSSYQAHGQGGVEVKNYKNYSEYLKDYVQYAIETYGK